MKLPLVAVLAAAGLSFTMATTKPAFASQVQPSVLGPAPALQRVHFTVHLPLRNEPELDALLASQAKQGSPLYHHFLTPAQFAAAYGPTRADLAAAASPLRAAGFAVRPTPHGLDVTGNANQVSHMFNAQVNSVRTREGRITTALTGRPTLPASLSALGAVVPAFSGVSRRETDSERSFKRVPDNRYSPFGPYWFDDLKEAYQFPSYLALNGRGSTVATVISSDFSDADLAQYMHHEKLPVPKTYRRIVDGGHPFDPNSGDSFEADLDIQQLAGIAPGATVADYEIPDLSDQSMYDAYAAVDDDNKVDVVNSSFGGCELYYTPAYNGGQNFTFILKANDQLFKQGNAQGITFTASSGDRGNYECQDPSQTHYIRGVGFPADSPRVTAVGGTNLVTEYTAPFKSHLDSGYIRESEYADHRKGLPNSIWGSGGGQSVIFPRPSYQALVGYKSAGRGIPDLSLQMGGCPSDVIDPKRCSPDDSASIEAFAGQLFGVIGTSISSPDFAGLIGLEVQYSGSRQGNVNPEAYYLARLGSYKGNKFYHNSIPGNNGYRTTAGYNLVVGNGSVIARNFIEAFNLPVAGDPQTPTNP